MRAQRDGPDRGAAYYRLVIAHLAWEKHLIEQVSPITLACGVGQDLTAGLVQSQTCAHSSLSRLSSFVVGRHP